MTPVRLDSPYKGLVPYTEEDAQLFFGREAEREIIAANLLANRLTLLYGPSGVGKSSVLQAGVVPDLRQQARRGLARHGRADAVPVVIRSWAGDPSVALLAEARRALEDLFGDRAADLPAAHDRMSATLEAWAASLDVELLLVLDQFEEHFTYGLGGDRHLFADEIAHLVGAPQLQARVLISIREDALARLDAFKGRIPGLFDTILRIEHLSLDAARTAIVRPVERFNELNDIPAAERRSVDPDLVEAVVAQVRSGEVALGRAAGGGRAERGTSAQVETPYLQLVMDRLWRTEADRGSLVLRCSSLTDIGGAEEIVRTHVASVMSALDEADQDVAAKAFHYLVTPSGSKVAHSADDLAGYTGAPAEQLVPLLERLCSAPIRILRPQPAPDRPDAPPRWEIVHDVLALAVLEWGGEREHEREAGERAERAREEERARSRRRVDRIRRLAAAAIALALVPIGLALEARSDAVGDRKAATSRARSAELLGVRSSVIAGRRSVFQVSLPEAWELREAPTRSTRRSATFTAGGGGRLRIDVSASLRQSERRFAGLQRQLEGRADEARTHRSTSVAGVLLPLAEFRLGATHHVLIQRSHFVLHGQGPDAVLIRSVTNFAASSFESLVGQLAVTVGISSPDVDEWRGTGTVLNGSDHEVEVKAAHLTYEDGGVRRRRRVAGIDCPAVDAGLGCSFRFHGRRSDTERVLMLVVRGVIRTDQGAFGFRRRANLVIDARPAVPGAVPEDSVVVRAAPEDAGPARVTRRAAPARSSGSEPVGARPEELPTYIVPDHRPEPARADEGTSGEGRPAPPPPDEAYPSARSRPGAETTTRATG